jgi:hypothetical protein
MKKYRIIAVVLFMMLNVTQVKSQENAANNGKKWGTELNFNPFDGSLSLNNSSGQIKVRRFLNDAFALRAGVLFNYKNFNDKEDQKYTTNPYKASNKRHSLETTINLGIEKHFDAGKRLSPYLGAEVGFGFKSAKQELELDSKTRTIKGAWEDIESTGSYYVQSFVENNYISAGANLLTGFDFYMSENFYFGYEFGFNVEFTKYGKIEITEDAGFSSSTPSPLPETTSGNWRMAPNVMNGIRIGYNF